MKVHYAKPYLTIDKQVDLLASRGLRIKDRSVARDLLTGVNYYRLTEWRNTSMATLDTRTFFAQLLLVYRMLRALPSICFDRTRWRRGVYRLLRAIPNCTVFDMARIMDVPSDFRKKFFWQ